MLIKCNKNCNFFLKIGTFESVFYSGVSKKLYFSKYIFRFLWNSLCEICTLCYWTFMRFGKIVLDKDSVFCGLQWNYIHVWQMCGHGSSVGIATELRAARSGIESRWGRDFPLMQTGPGAHPASRKMGTVSFPGVKCGRGVLLTTHPLLVPRSWKSRAIPLPTLCATPGL